MLFLAMPSVLRRKPAVAVQGARQQTDRRNGSSWAGGDGAASSFYKEPYLTLIGLWKNKNKNKNQECVT